MCRVFMADVRTRLVLFVIDRVCLDHVTVITVVRANGRWYLADNTGIVFDSAEVSLSV